MGANRLTTIFEFQVEEKEGHGLRQEELSTAHHRRVDSFLKKYVPPPGGRVEIGPATVVEPNVQPEAAPSFPPC